MKFTVATKPFQTALGLGVVSKNISPFYSKSTLALLTITQGQLVVQLEALQVYSEITLKGSCDKANQTDSVFVQCEPLKKLVSTFDAPTTELEIIEGGLALYSGKSRFVLPKAAESFMTLKSPEYVPNTEGLPIEIDDWRFIKNHQMFAIAKTTTNPVYTRVWVSDKNDVLVGDLTMGIFTYSKRPTLGKTCLLSTTIVNLFDSIPYGAKVYPNGETFILSYINDAFEYRAEFVPQYETDPDMGSFHSDVILAAMGISHDKEEEEQEEVAESEQEAVIEIDAMKRIVNQLNIIASGSDDLIKLIVGNDVITISSDKADGQIPYESEISIDEYTLHMSLNVLNDAFSKFASDRVSIRPIYNDGEITALYIGSTDLKITIAADIEE